MQQQLQSKVGMSTNVDVVDMQVSMTNDAAVLTDTFSFLEEVKEFIVPNSESQFECFLAANPQQVHQQLLI